MIRNEKQTQQRYGQICSSSRLHWTNQVLGPLSPAKLSKPNRPQPATYNISRIGVKNNIYKQ